MAIGMPRRPAAILALVLVPAVAAGAWFALSRPPKEPIGRGPAEPERTEALPPPEVSASRFRNTDPSVSYVGTDRCVECHPQEHATFRATAHSRSMALLDPAGQPPDGGFAHPESRRAYAIERRDGRMVHRESLALGDGRTVELTEHAMKYVVGSGRFGHSYLAESDGFLVQSPVTWYTHRRTWDMSPGYDAPRHQSFQRIVSSDCLFCHAGRFEAEAGNPFRLTVHETAIGCERCHGPGELHVAAHAAGGGASGPVDETIVNPEKLPRRLAEAVCEQCHLQGDAQVLVRGRETDDFRPGLPLEEFRIEYRERRADDPQMTIVGHVEQMRLSPCWQGSDTLTCVTCHEPHGKQAETPEWFRSVCLTCHQDGSCGEPLPVRREKADNQCVRCHMPQVPTEVPHVAFTQHRIGIHPSDPAGGEAEPGAADAPVTVQDLSRLSEADRDRSLGLAQLRLARDARSAEDHAARLAEAETLLRAAHDRGARDAAVLAGLADVAMRSGRAAEAVRLAGELLGATHGGDESRVRALEILAEVAFRNGRFDEAARRYGELTTLRRNARHWFFLGLSRQNTGDTEGAVAALRRSLDIDPLQDAAPSALAAILEASGDPAKAAEYRQWAAFLSGVGQAGSGAAP